MSLTDDILMHYGMPRRSGRYPWGSGDNPYQHSGDFLSRVEELKKSNFTFTDKDGKTYTGEVAIAKSMGLSTTQFRTQMSLAKDERRSADVATAKALRAKGYSLNEIADKMGFANDSSVRSLLNESSEARMNQAKQTAEFLKKQIAEKGMIDVGTGVERELGISKEKMNQALYILEMEGYPIYGGGVPQVTNPGKQTNIKVLCPPGTEHKEIYNFENVHSVRDYVSHDDGETFDKFVYPKSMDSSRLKIRYAEDGGIQKDGVIEIRRGVDDLSLGDSHYAQVRILVDGNRYLKGMAVYRKVCIELLRELFDTLPKKDRDILGKTCGVFGYSEASLKEIGMYHMMKESAVEKAKNRAVEKLREAYPGSRLQVWRAVHRMMRRPVPPPGEDSELRRNFPQYVLALAEVYGVLNEATSDIDNISI